MTTYEKLDWIADSIIPIVAMLALVLPWLPTYRATGVPWKRLISTLLCVGLAYAVMALDQYTGTWPAMSLDYSTHSAVCLALLISLAHLSRRWMLNNFQTPGRFGWNGGFGTSAYVDPAERMIGILFTQRLMASPEPPKVFTDFWTTAYSAMA